MPTRPTFDVTETHDALARELMARDVTALAAAPAQDANAFVVRRETAERFGLQRLSDLTKVASQLTFGGPPECPSRPLCLVGLEEVYGLKFEEFVALDVGGPLTRDALRDATSSTSRCCSRRTRRSRVPTSSNSKMIAACNRQRTSRRSSALAC